MQILIRIRFVSTCFHMCHSVVMMNTGVISGALLYIRDDFDSVNKSSFLQVVSLESPLNSTFGGSSFLQYGTSNILED